MITKNVEADSSDVGFTTSASFRYLKRRKDKTISDDENGSRFKKSAITETLHENLCCIFKIV